MKVPLKWLREYVRPGLPAAEIARRLTMAGNEARQIEPAGKKWENVVIGRITAVNPHPNADRLRLVTVDAGNEQPTVVCGAPNTRAGDKVAFARVGAELIDPHTGKTSRLTPAKIRGVVSAGMACSEKELGISESHEGILILPPDAPVGMPLSDYLSDIVFDLEVTPNRPDCLSVIGIAREVSALTGENLRLPEPAYGEAAPPVEERLTVEIIEPELCPRYCASLVTGVRLGPSPAWMQERLLACGMRPINNIVDITNYVMLEYGQPLHAFDYDKVQGKGIIVRRARSGETTATLDGVSRVLSDNTLVIADKARAVALAGVMGGANSEVTESTTSILLEAASFNPANIHYTSRNLGLVSEASMRFERGVRPGMTIPAIRRATQLIVELGGGQAAQGIIDVYPGRQEAPPVPLTMRGLERVLGTGFTFEQISSVLRSLGFDCILKEASVLLATPPYWRGDIRFEVDVIEEVARITGYDKIPMTMLAAPLPRQTPDPRLAAREKIARCLTGAGFHEIVTYSLVALDALNRLMPQPHPLEPAPLRVANPMTADQEYLRPTLRANLLAAYVSNRRYETGGIRLYELDKTYRPRQDDLPEEPETLVALMGGARREKSWTSDDDMIDFFDAKGVAETLFRRLDAAVSFEPGNDEGLHPGKQLAIVAGGKRVGVLGEVHPGVRDAFEIAEPVYLLEVNVSGLLSLLGEPPLFQPIPRFPSVTRDLALVVDYGVAHQQVYDVMSSFPLVRQVTVFDVYAGKQVPPGKKSLAYRIVYQAADHTLTDDEVNNVQQQVLDRLARELGAALRG
ncbi:MAG: phenylalanine--tRNA ligase subunit beta [Chloroflexi bacterium]|nr:phenylalanine--tRNA ligase subunit beta [Chloroflexota bacterium]